VSELTWYIGLIINALLVEIGINKEKMIQVAFEEGFTSDNTIEVSQFIDNLLNELNRIKINTSLYVSVTFISENSKMLAEQKQANSEVAASVSYLNESESISLLKASMTTSKINAIDILLQNSKDRSKRVYRGFYFDNDVLSIVDRFPKSYKSELVNEALRKILKEKGLLD
jgi:hypothetical protein